MRLDLPRFSLLVAVFVGCGGTVASGAAGDAGAPDAVGTADSGIPFDGGSPLDARALLDTGMATLDGDVDGASGDAALSCGAGNVFFLPFSTYPKLVATGGSALVHVPGYTDPACGQDQAIVLQPSAGQFLAFSGSSTDICCNIAYVAPDLQSVCGHATYDLTGKCISGNDPALPPLVVCTNSAGVGVTP